MQPPVPLTKYQKKTKKKQTTVENKVKMNMSG
jgi:hypothetical protein